MANVSLQPTQLVPDTKEAPKHEVHVVALVDTQVLHGATHGTKLPVESIAKPSAGSQEAIFPFLTVQDLHPAGQGVTLPLPSSLYPD